MSTGLQILLIVEYLVLGIAAAVDHRYWLALYWLGACVLTLGVVGGMR